MVSPIFNRVLEVGRSGEDVRRLQQLLNSNLDTKVTNTGSGSPGQETDYFGLLTKKAVGKFQLKYAVVSSEQDDGYGVVGPRTRAKLAEVFTTITPTITATTVVELQTKLQQLLEQLLILLQAQAQALLQSVSPPQY